MTDASKIQLETSLDTRPVKQGLQEIVQAAEGAATGVQNAGAKSGKAFDGVGAGAEASAKKIENAEKSIIASIQRRTAAVQAAGQSESKYYEELARQRGVSTDNLRPYLQQLDAAKARQDAATASLGKMGVSAAQTAAALRGVPAQFTDIVTSLASGQQPITVLLQQGGQLKDMFGGAGNAARALGGYVAGLVNPFTITAAAIGAVAYGAFKGAEELQAFNKTLILNGGTAGVTADKLMAMAAGIDAINTGITQGKAAEALNQLVEAGVRGEAQLGRYAQAAVEFERAGGGAAAEVAKQFGALGKEPLQASLKLNDAMGYLSASTFETIRSLDAQGKTIEAARVAQDAYADAIQTRTPALVQNLGYIEQAWRGISGAASEAIDALKGIGRPESQEDQLARVRTMIANKLPAQGKYGGVVDGELAYLREQEKRLATNLAYNQRDAVVAAEKAQKEKERIAFLGQADKYLTSEQRQQREILAVQNLVTRQIITQEEAEKRIAAIRASNAKTPRKTREGDPFASERTAAAEWAKYLEQFSDITADAEGKVLGLSKGQAKLVEYLQSPAYKNASESMRELALQTVYAAIAAEQAAEAYKKEQAAIEVSINALANRVEKEQNTAANIAEQVRQQTEATAAYGLSGQALVELEVARLNDAAAERERQAVVAAGIDPMLAEAYREQAQALRDLAAAKQNDAAVRKLVDQQRQLWKDVDRFAENAFMDVAMNGEAAFKRIGESLKREVIQMLYEMTLKKWIFQIFGVSGGVGGNMGTSLLSSAAQSYMNGGSALGSSANAVGSWATGSMSGANAYGSVYANMTGTGMDGLLATNGAYGTAAGTTTASSTMTSGGFTGYGYLGYAALIAAAVMIAENLYAKGYTRLAVGKGPGETNKFGYTQFTSDPNMGNSTAYNISPENRSRMIFDALGMNEKWADILSGTTRMGTLFGRKLGAYGYEADIAGGNADVSGFARYKGGLFRSNKTVGIDIDPRDAANIDAMVEAQIEGSRNMARAMGLSTEAIDAYTGSIKINMKGAETAEEQAKRAAEAMDNLNFELLKTASGGKLAREDFKKFMEGIQEDIQQAGISAAGIADILLQGMTGRLSGADVGAQLSDMILGGIYNAIASSAAGQISQLFMTQIITPIFTAIASGVPLSQAVSAAAMKQTVETARQYMEAVKVVFNDPEFQAWVQEFKGALNKLGGDAAKVAAPSMRTFSVGPSQAQLAAQEAKREREQLEKELLTLQGNTVELRRRELLALKPANRALQEQIWRLQDIKDTWTDIMDAISGEMKSLRDELLGTSEAARAAAMSEFTIATAAARSGDSAAAQRLPELARAVADMAKATSDTLAQQQYTLAYLFNSLDQTRTILSGKYGLEIPKFADGGYHSGGLRLVGERGPELEVTGPARYWDASQTSQMLNGGGAEVAGAISKLAERMSTLERAMNQVAVNTGSAARTLSDMQADQQYVGA